MSFNVNEMAPMTWAVWDDLCELPVDHHSKSFLEHRVMDTNNVNTIVSKSERKTLGIVMLLKLK